MENETVIVKQRQGIGSQIIQARILEAQCGLHLPAHLLLAKEVGDVVGAKCAGGVSFAESRSHCVRSIFPHQRQQLADLSSQRPVSIRQTPQIGLAGRA